MTTSLAIETSDPLVGTRIDNRYLVQSVLGRGGMGVVYAGLHEHLGREVAIKVLGPGIANDPVAVQRFLREARTASQLTHGNIVDVSDLGTLPDGRPYLVMARLHGEDLCTLLQRCGPQTPQRTVHLLRGAASALDLIHAKGYLHRDVKPENLMHVVREDGSEAVLLLDFGIVGLVSPNSARLTDAGVLFGTPVYIAPELVRGAPPSAASDVYALATVAFELMTGMPPFNPPNLFELLQSKVTQAAPQLRDVTGFELPAGVEAVIATALNRDPTLRHPTAGAFVSALAAAVRACSADELRRMAAGFEAITQTRQRKASEQFEQLLTESVVPKVPKVIDTERMPATVESGPTEPLEPASLPPPPQATDVVVAPRFIDRHWVKLAAGAGVTVLLGVGVHAALRDRAAHEPETPAHVRDVPPPQPSAASAAVVPEAPTSSSPAPSPEPQPAVRNTSELTRKPPAPQTPAPQTPARKPAASTAQTSEPRKPATTTKPAGDGRALAAGLVQRAQAELVQGHLATAGQLYELATQADPHNASAFRGVGLVEERLGHVPEAIHALHRALVLDPDEPTNPLLKQRLRQLELAHPK